MRRSKVTAGRLQPFVSQASIDLFRATPEAARRHDQPFCTSSTLLSCQKCKCSTRQLTLQRPETAHPNHASGQLTLIVPDVLPRLGPWCRPLIMVSLCRSSTSVTSPNTKPRMVTCAAHSQQERVRELPLLA